MKVSRKIISVEPIIVESTFTMDDGAQWTVSTADLSPEILAEVVAYGLGRILPDRTSSSDKSDKLSDMQDVWSALKEGSFSKRASGSSAAEKVEAAKAKLATFASLPSEMQAALEAMQMGRSFLEGELKKAEKALQKALASKK